MSRELPVPNHPWIRVIEGPLFRQTLPASATDEELASMLNEVERITRAMQTPYGWVTDISQVTRATAVQRRMYADSEQRLAPWDAQYCAGTGVCCKNAMTRGILTAVQWLSPPTYPMKVFTSSAEAEAWARRQLVLRGVVFAGSR